MRYRYTGPHPVEDEAGELVHPGDVREMDEAPPWGPWDPVPHATGELPDPPPPASHLAQTPPALAAQGILARGASASAEPEGM